MSQDQRALIVAGGWDGHQPKPMAELFADRLTRAGLAVSVHDDLAVYADPAEMDRAAVIVQVWTMGEISDEAWAGLDHAVRRGVGFAGFHGGVLDSFRGRTDYQFMTGGQFVAHPGNNIPRYRVDLTDMDHPITRGLSSFEVRDSEQYYVHVDPAVRVLATTTFSGEHGDRSLYEAGAVVPAAWTKRWGQGRVFAATWGHQTPDFDTSEALEVVVRGIRWAAKTPSA